MVVYSVCLGRMTCAARPLPVLHMSHISCDDYVGLPSMVVYSVCLDRMTCTARPLSVELAYRSGNVMDCHATARGSMPGRNVVFIELHVLRKGH